MSNTYNTTMVSSTDVIWIFKVRGVHACTIEVATAEDRQILVRHAYVVRSCLMAKRSIGTRRRRNNGWQGGSCPDEVHGLTLDGRRSPQFGSNLSWCLHGKRFDGFLPIRWLLTYWRAVFVCSIICCCKQANQYTLYTYIRIYSTVSACRQLLVIYTTCIGTGWYRSCGLDALVYCF